MIRKNGVEKMELELKEKWLEEWEKTLKNIKDFGYDVYDIRYALYKTVEFYNKLYSNDEKIILGANFQNKVLFCTINLFERSIKFYLEDGVVLSFHLLFTTKNIPRLCFSVYSLTTQC